MPSKKAQASSKRATRVMVPTEFAATDRLIFNTQRRAGRAEVLPRPALQSAQIRNGLHPTREPSTGSIAIGAEYCHLTPKQTHAPV